MKRSLLVSAGWTICLMVFALQMVAQDLGRIDLHHYGYVMDTPSKAPFLTKFSSQIVSVGENGETVVGFVTHDRFGLATRELPPLSLHVVRFAKDGTFLFEGTIPTSSWDENAIFYGSNGSLLIRTGTKLGLYSSDLKKSKEMDLPLSTNSVRIMWGIFPLPNRKAFLLTAHPSMRVLDWADLKPLRECQTSQYFNELSVSNDEILFVRPNLGETQHVHSLDVNELCGPMRFSYSWDGDPLGATLLHGDRFLLANYSPFIVAIAGNTVQWRTDFDKNSDVVADHVEVSADGEVLSVAVIEFGSGSRFLDISRKVKSVKVVVFRAKNGQRLLATSVIPTPVSRFDFALSPDGKSISIVSDGFLQICSAVGGNDEGTRCHCIAPR